MTEQVDWDALDKLAEQITPGGWKWRQRGGDRAFEIGAGDFQAPGYPSEWCFHRLFVGVTRKEADSAFPVALVNAYPSIRAEVTALRERIEWLETGGVGSRRREGVTSRLEIVTLAIELRDASIALAKLTCDTRIPKESLAAYLEAEVRPDYKALRKALRERPEPQAESEPGATAAVASARWRAAAAEEFASRMRDQRRSP